MSSNGQYQTAVAYGAGIYINSTGNNGTGGTWTLSTFSPTLNWDSIAISSTGQYQTAVVYGGGIYYNSNYGQGTWTPFLTPGLVLNWNSVAMSSDGNYQTAVSNAGGIYSNSNATNTNTNTSPYTSYTLNGSIGIGPSAASYKQASNSIAIGNNAGLYNQGPGSVAIGYYAAGYTGFTGGYTGGQGTNSVAIGYQAGYQNDNTITITAPYVSTNSSIPGSSANANVGFSSTGQYIGYTNVNTIYLSYNFGQAFVAYTPLLTNVYAYNISSSGQYHLCPGISSGTATVPFYYSSDYGVTFTPVYYSGTIANPGQFGGRYMSANGQYMCMFSANTNVVVYSNNGGALGIPSFTTLGTSNGLTSTSGYGQGCMDTTGRYIVAGSLTTANYGIYYSSNGQSVPTTITFTLLGITNGLPLSTTFNACSISGNGQYILAGANTSPYVTYLSSNANNGNTASITFSIINGLPVNSRMWNTADISDTGQYMVMVTQNTLSGYIYISYNYGVNWSVFSATTGLNMVRVGMSLNGKYIMALPYNTVPATGILLVLSTIPSNTNDIAIGYQAGYQNQNGNSIAIGTTAGSVNQPVNAIAVGNGAGYQQTSTYNYNGTYGPAVQVSTITTTFSSAMSYDGKYIIFGQWSGTTTTGSNPSFSNNYGESFSLLSSFIIPTSVTIGSIAMSSNGQYMVFVTTPSTSSTGQIQTCYYSVNGTASAISSITASALSVISGNAPVNNTIVQMFNGYSALCMSSTGQYILFANYSASLGNGYTFGTPNNYVYYSCNGGPSSTAISITFTNITTGFAPGNGLPAAQTTAGNGLWYQSGMSSSGQYIIMPYAATATGLQNLYYSSNGNAATPASLVFSTLPATAGIPSIGANATALVYMRNVSMSGTGQYILVNVYGGFVYLSSNGTSGAANVTFTNISNRLTSSTTAQNWAQCGISNSGQYMFTAIVSTSIFYVSTNYGVNWTNIQLTLSGGIDGNCCISGDGTKIILTGTNFGGNYSFTIPLTLQQNTSFNTVAIGYNAGNYNQGPNSVCIGNTANAQISDIGADGAVVINGTGSSLSANGPGFFVKPVRSSANGQTSAGALYYSSAGEICYVPQTQVTVPVSTTNIVTAYAVNWIGGIGGNNITITNPNTIMTVTGRGTLYNNFSTWVYINLRLYNITSGIYYYIQLNTSYNQINVCHVGYALYASGTLANIVYSPASTALPLGTYNTLLYGGGLNNTVYTDSGDCIVVNISMT